jgi:hypothetical protein
LPLEHHGVEGLQKFGGLHIVVPTPPIDGLEIQELPKIWDVQLLAAPNLQVSPLHLMQVMDTFSDLTVGVSFSVL